MTGFLLISAGFYVLALGLGLLLRAFLVFPFSGIVFSHVMHAHSHTLYFGWAALGIFALAFERGRASKRLVRFLLAAIVGISLATFVSFLEGGYSVPSIVVSSLSLFLWWGAAATFLTSVRGETGLGLSYLRVGMVYLLLSTLGALGRVAVLAMGVQDPFWGRMAVFAFLFCFAWFFVFSLFGLLVVHQERLGAHFDEALLRNHLRLAAPIAWLTFPLGVAGGSEG